MNTADYTLIFTQRVADGQWGLYFGFDAEEFPGRGETWSAAPGVLTLNNLNFATTDDVALTIDRDTRIVLNGANTITSNPGGGIRPSFGLFIAGNLTFSGAGSLTAAAGHSMVSNSIGIDVQGGCLHMESGTVTAIGRTANHDSAGIWADSFAMTGGTLYARGNDFSMKIDSGTAPPSGPIIRGCSADGTYSVKGKFTLDGKDYTITEMDKTAVINRVGIARRA